MQINIKKMEASDIDAIYEIEKNAYGEHHWSKESFYSELQNNIGYYIVAHNCETNEVVGYLGSWFIVDECHITTVAVKPQFRRQNIGTKLLISLINQCYEKFIKYITLEVRISNISAISLYEKFGFKSIGVRKKYYQDNNEDALIMFTENIWYEKFKTLYNSFVGKI